MSTKKILLGITGSIAAFRAAELVRIMIRKNWEVHVLMTEGAMQFITPLTFYTLSRNPVGTSLWDSGCRWKPEHITMAEKVDAFVIAPCTANVIAKITHGIADDLLSCTALASTSPIIIAPAMNVYMWENEATQDNVNVLRSRGITIMDVELGDLACGYEGQGRLANLARILKVVESVMR